MDSDKKKKNLFNFFDLAILIILILAVAGVSFIVLYEPETPEAEKKNIVYSIELKNVSEGLFRQFSVGEQIRDSSSGEVIGEVASVRSIPSTAILEDKTEGVYVKTSYPGHEDVYITVRAVAESTNTAYLINGYRVSVGGAVHLKTSRLTASGYCTSLYEE